MQVHSVLESLQQGILICDQHSRIVFFNQVYSDFIGVPLETAKGQKITDYRKSAIAPEVKNTLLLYGRDMEGKQKAAKELGISLATLYNKIKE